MSIDFRALGIGVGSTPAAALVLVALFVIMVSLNWLSHKLKEVPMYKKSEETKSKTCVVKCCLTVLAKPTAYIFDVVWAIGAGVVAAVVSPSSIH